MKEMFFIKWKQEVCLIKKFYKKYKFNWIKSDYIWEKATDFNYDELVEQFKKDKSIKILEYE